MGAPDPSSIMRPIDQAIYRLLVAAADAGECCPTNPVLAEHVHARSPAGASEAVSRLERRHGLISVTRGNCSRVVTILETGRRTAGPIPEPHWRNRTADERTAPALVRPSTAPRHVAQATPMARDENLAARIDADQARQRAQRETWLDVEQQRYGLTRRGRLIEEMPA